MASSAFFRTFRSTCSIWARSIGYVRERLEDLDAHADAALLGVRLHEAGDPRDERADVTGLPPGGRQAHDVRKAPDERVQLLRPGDDDFEGVHEVRPVLRAELAGVGETGLEERARGAERVVDLVRHHPDELLVRGLLGFPQLLR